MRLFLFACLPLLALTGFQAPVPQSPVRAASPAKVCARVSPARPAASAPLLPFAPLLPAAPAPQTASIAAPTLVRPAEPLFRGQEASKPPSLVGDSIPLTPRVGLIGQTQGVLPLLLNGERAPKEGAARVELGLRYTF